MSSGSLNNFPDDNISVVTAQDSIARIWSHANAKGVRILEHTKAFPHYGAAKLYADECEDLERKQRLR